MYGERSIDMTTTGHSALPFRVGATGGNAFRRLLVAAPAVATAAAVVVLQGGERQAGRAQEIETF